MAFLTRKNIKHGAQVLLLLSTSPDSIIAFLALLELGTAYVPLCLKASIETNVFIVHEIKAMTVLSDMSLQSIAIIHLRNRGIDHAKTQQFSNHVFETLFYDISVALGRISICVWL